MSETDFLKLKKHDNVETNTEKFDIENYLNSNWDKINENAKKVNTDISNINSKNKEQDTNIEQLQENTETSSNKIAKLETELKEMKEDFYQASIRGQASGEYIHVEDSSNCRAKIDIGGNSEQETREGYNLLNNTLQSQTINGLKVTVNEDKSVAIVGTATDTTPLIFDQSKATLPAGTYILKDCGTFIESEENQGSWDSGETKTFTADATLSSSGFYKYYRSGEVVNVTLYPILIKGSELKPYEQYGAMPSPDYISSIVAVGSNANELENTAKTQTIKDVTFTVNEDGTVVANGTASQQVTLVLTKVLSLQKGDYMISGCPRGGTTATYRIDVWKSDWSSLGFEVGNGTKISLSESIENAIVGITITKGTTVENMVFKPKVEKGKVATPWSPHGQGCVEINVSNENLAKKDNITNLYFNQNQISIGATSKTIIEKCLPNMTYTISKIKSTKFRVCTTNKIPQSNETIIDYIYNDTENKITITTSDKAKYMCIYFYDSNTDTLTEKEILDSIQIKIGSKSTAYEQHEEQSYIMPVQKEMLEGDYVADVEHHEWKKLTLTGNENIKLNTAFANVFNIEIPKINIMNQQVCLCNIAKGVVYNTALLTIQDNIIMTASLNKIVYKSTKFSSLSEFKTYLQNQYEEGTPVIVYYKLAEPINLELTDEQKAVAKELNNARTYKNVTNITTDSKAILSLDYAKDQETQNQKMQNEIDEIKQLLSTTQTSALLLDNMQTDIESEVK